MRWFPVNLRNRRNRYLRKEIYKIPKLSDSFLNLSYPVGAALCGRPIREPTEGLPYDIFSP